MTSDVYSGFLGQLRQAGSGRGERDTKDAGSTPRSLRACLRSPEKRQKNNACYAGYPSWAKI